MHKHSGKEAPITEEEALDAIERGMGRLLSEALAEAKALHEGQPRRQGKRVAVYRSVKQSRTICSQPGLDGWYSLIHA